MKRRLESKDNLMDLIQVPREKSMKLSVTQQITARTTVMRIDSVVQEKGVPGIRCLLLDNYFLTPLDKKMTSF